MERKIETSLFTTPIDKLVLQITGRKDNMVAWTKFIDANVAKPEYENPIWTKDEKSTNPKAVAAVMKMIQIEADHRDGKIDTEKAKADFKLAYEEWRAAHIAKNPKFVERAVLGLSFDFDEE